MNHFATLTRFGLVVVAWLAIAAAASAVTLAGANVKGNTLVIPKAGIGGKAVFFAFTVDGVKMEAFAVKAGDGTIRTALNTCQVCYNSGRGWYVQEGNEMVCQNCGNRFNIEKIERIKNGCNPIPITKDLKTETKDTITITADVLASGKQFFARWKK